MPSPRCSRLLVAVLVLGCGRDLPLPPRPEGAPSPVITALRPESGFSLDEIAIVGTDLPTGAGVEVRFGASGPVTPLEGASTQLRVRVPHDATTGPVVVSSSSARATSGTFTFLGAGRLRHRRIAARADLRPSISLGAAIGGTVFAIDTTRYDQLVRLNTPTRAVGLHSLMAMRPTSDGAVLVLDSDEDEDDLPTGAVCGGHLTRVGANGVVSWRVPLVQDSGSCSWFRSLATSKDERFVALASNTGVALVDLGATPPAVTVFEALDAVAQVAWVGRDRFVVATGDGLQLLERDGAWRLRRPLELLDGDSVEAIDARDDGRVALLASTGELVVLDAAPWPPVELGRTSILRGDTGDARLAWSRSGAHLLVTQPRGGRVLTFDVDGEATPAPVASFSAEEPALAWAGTDGLFWVGVRGGLALVSQRTGLLVETLPVEADLTNPVLRTAELLDSNDEVRTAPVLEVGSRAFDRVLRLDPTTLERLPRRSMLRLARADRLDRLAALPARPELFLARNDRLETWDGAATPARRDGVRAFPEGWLTHAFGLLPAPHLLWMHATDAGDVLFVADAAKGLGDAAPPIELGEVRAVVADEGRFGVVAPGEVRVLDAARALAGDATPLATVPFENEVIGRTDVAASRGRLFAVTYDADATSLETIDLVAGAHLGSVPFGLEPLFDSLTASPGGHQLWWLAETSLGHRLSGAAIDPATGRVLAMDPPLPLPSPPTHVAPTPDGERLHLTTTRDELLLVE